MVLIPMKTMQILNWEARTEKHGVDRRQTDKHMSSNQPIIFFF